MRRVATALALFCLLLLAPFLLAQGAAPVPVVRVIDGDTFDVRDGERTVTVRLFGVDCPEIAQPYGPEARDATRAFIEGKAVTLVFSGKLDRFGRPLVDAGLPDGSRLSERLAADGWAWWAHVFAPRDAALANGEIRARADRRGLWKGDDPEPPWAFRLPAPGDANDTVFFTPGGEKYHKQTCSTLKNSTVVQQGTRATAEQGPPKREACKICKP